MRKQLIALAVLLAVVLTGCSKPQTTWITDLDEAKTASTKTKKDLVLVFTGSDWNEPSQALITNVFNDEFFQLGSKDYVLCNIDIVNDSTLVDQETMEKNYTIASQYNVQMLPYFVFITSTDDVYGSGSLPDGTDSVETLLAFFNSYADARKSLLGLKKEITGSKGAERATNIDTFLTSIDPSQSANYEEFIREVPELDADGALGLKGKYLLQAAYLDAIELYQTGNLTGAGDFFITLAEGTDLKASEKQEAWYMGAYLYSMSEPEDNTQVIEWLQKAVDVDPENEGAAQIRAAIESLKEQKSK